jgi:NitT/TauT family transport system substrate-binding protein
MRSGWMMIVATLAGLVTLALSPPAPAQDLADLAADAELVETRTQVPRLRDAAAYEPQDGIVEIELSEYAGYAGLIVANGGLEPNPESVFAQRHGFQLRIKLSEAESWSALNSGRMAASATTADVLAVYGRQFRVTVPAQIGLSRGATGIVTRSDIRRINDLRGKTLATAQFTEADFFIRYLAQEAGIAVHKRADLRDQPRADAINLVYTADAFGAGDLFLRDLQAGRDRIAGCITWAPKTTEVADESEGKAHVLVTNRNLLIVADILIVNKGFADAHPQMVAGLVDGLLEGNRKVRDNPQAHLGTIAAAFGWSEDDVKAELAQVHLSNLPENLAFFSGAIDAAGSFGGIYQSAVYAYGTDMVPNAPPAERFLDLSHLQALQADGRFADQRVAIAPIRGEHAGPIEGDPLLSKDIRFYFLPNSSELDVNNPENLEQLRAIRQLLQVSPGSTVLLRGHVDNAMVPQFRQQGGESFVRQMALRAMQLSKERAESVEKLLVQREGISAERLEAIGRGWDEPISEVSEENRRVEVQWFTIE